MIAELAQENVLGKYYDIIEGQPVITAQLAPGNHGLFAISTFEEVAYYGNPDAGTALQFLGGKNSPNIRFVVDGPNSPLSIDRTTVPAVVSQAQAVLTAQDSGASLTITAALKGGDYDDVQFVFKRINEDAKGLLSPDRRDGWVEYDPGTSHAFAQATFKDAVTNQPVENSAFYVTATERGDMYNNVDIVMRLDDYYSNPDPVSVTFDAKTGQLRISIDSTKAHLVTTNDIITAINNSNVSFKAELSYSEDPLNDGSAKLDNIGLSAGRYTTIANTGNTGGHVGGTVTVWLADENPGPGAPDIASEGVYRHPTQEDIVRLINNDPVVSKMFVAKAYSTVQGSDGKLIDFVKDGPIVSSGGLVEPALITVHLATDSAGNVITTAAQLAAWWNQLDPELIDGISASIVRPPGAVWDDCNDPYGKGILGPTIARGECDEWIINDIQFVGWDDNSDQLHYVSKYSTGTMTSQRGINSSYQLIAKNLGPEWDGYSIEYINNETLTGRFADNMVDGSGVDPCDDPYYSGLLRDDCGNLITPNSTTEKGLALYFDEQTKKITINVRFGVTTANDIMQLINNDPRTRNKFSVVQLGDGTGYIHADDNTLLTKGGAEAPGNLNGAKLLFGSDATDYYLIFKSMGYGSDQFVDVRAKGVGENTATTFTTTDADGKKAESVYGKDADVVINGMQASVNGLDVSLNTSALSVDFTLSEFAGTMAGWETDFTINGGGATFQVGPDVVSRQQITLGIRSINTVQLGGASGVLNQLRSGQDASLDPVKGDTNKAFRIVQESLLAITSIRGRLGTMQRATLETNINVLNDTLVAITEAESQIRDTDFAEETSNLTRAQILVQANMNTLGVANQIPNYMLSLLGR
jgi:flagellin-like hook-associated protein FlgL